MEVKTGWVGLWATVTAESAFQFMEPRFSFPKNSLSCDSMTIFEFSSVFMALPPCPLKLGIMYPMFLAVSLSCKGSHRIPIIYPNG